MENPTASDWAAARGEKWSSQLTEMEGMLAPVHEPLLRAARLDAPLRVAEVGCGGGGTALELLRRAPAGSTVHGFDISPDLIARARARIPAGEQHLTFELADMAVAAPPEPYDRLVSRFGIMFFDDPPAAFTNLVRWLKPGGFFAFAAWGPPAENAWVKTAREVVARIVEIPPPDPDAPGPFRYADAARFVALLTRAGFTEVNAEPWRGTLPVGGGLPPAEAAHFALSSFATFAELLAKAGEAATAEARRALAARFSEEQHDGVVRMGACVNIVTGVRA